MPISLWKSMSSPQPMAEQPSRPITGRNLILAILLALTQYSRSRSSTNQRWPWRFYWLIKLHKILTAKIKWNTDEIRYIHISLLKKQQNENNNTTTEKRKGLWEAMTDLTANSRPSILPGVSTDRVPVAYLHSLIHFSAGNNEGLLLAVKSVIASHNPLRFSVVVLLFSFCCFFIS